MQETGILKISVIASLCFAVFGVTWGLIVDSGMIIFDGVYSLISVALSGLSLWILRQIALADQDNRFPFGKAHFEPLLITFKSLTLIGMCSFSAINAVSELLNGGREVDPGSAILYALISTIGCFGLTMLLQQKNKHIESSLLEAEKNQWLGDLLLSVAVLIGFCIAWFFTSNEYSDLVPLIDPAMVILASIIFIVFPIKSLIFSLKQVIYHQTNTPSTQAIHQAIEEIASELGATTKVRMVLVGREVNIEANFLMKNDNLSIADMDSIRDRIAGTAEQHYKQHWININFTEKTHWI